MNIISTAGNVWANPIEVVVISQVIPPDNSTKIHTIKKSPKIDALDLRILDSIITKADISVAMRQSNRNNLAKVSE